MNSNNKKMCILNNCFIPGPTGSTERLFKSSNKKIIDSNSIIPYNEKKDNILHNIS